MFSSSKKPLDHICVSFGLVATTDEGAELPSYIPVLAISGELRMRGYEFVNGNKGT